MHVTCFDPFALCLYYFYWPPTPRSLTTAKERTPGNPSPGSGVRMPEKRDPLSVTMLFNSMRGGPPLLQKIQVRSWDRKGEKAILAEVETSKRASPDRGAC